jgi:hypothetical protein
MSLFNNFIMQGFVKKRVDKVKFFQKKLFYKRYIKIDYTIGVVYISDHVTDKDNTGAKTIKFSHFKSVKLFEPEIEQ